jgi:hypothetical protein
MPGLVAGILLVHDARGNRQKNWLEMALTVGTP